MTPQVLGLFFALTIGIGASVYLWHVRRRAVEMGAGLTALAAMRWRDFAALVLRMLKERGYTPLSQQPLGRGDQPDFILQRAGEQCVVSCKHGSAYFLGAGDLKELADSLHVHGASSGKMITAGHFASDALPEARRHGIELIDGVALWPQVAPLLPTAQLEHLQSTAAFRTKREIGMAWLLAVVVGLAVALLAPRRPAEPAEIPTPAALDAGTQPAVPAAAPPGPADLPATPTQSPAPPVQHVGSEVQQRQEARRAIAALPDVERAIWSTRSTLLVFLLADNDQPWTEICRVLAPYPAVRAVRVQLTPPEGSTSLVRFRQCFAY